MKDTQPITQDLVLIGGGHSHAIVLKRLGMKPLAGVRLTLITNVVHTPYSGMLPGYVAGFYNFDQCHIDLVRLSRFAHATLILDQAVGLDLQQNRVLLAEHPPLAFDWLSIDIGSTPAALSVPGSAEHTIAVKPIAQFLQAWDRLVEQVAKAPDQPLRLAVVGGGAGGVELGLAIQSRLQSIYQAAAQPRQQFTLHLFQRDQRLIPERPPAVGRWLHHHLVQGGAIVHLRENVNRISTTKTGAKQIQCASGLQVECDQVFWVTQAAAASWLATSGLKTNQRGFVLVNDCLQSLSHPHVFAAGDVATVDNHPRPKAGVFAVRQGKPLEQNLRRVLNQQPPRRFVPQKEFLILVGVGERAAVASRGGFSLPAHPWLWQWKEAIDRRFMQQFCQLPPMSMSPRAMPSRPQSATQVPLPCAGCGSKVGSGVLERSLQRIQQERPALARPDVLLGLEAAEDAAVVQIPPGQVLVQTVDQFRSLLNDPFEFGQICAHHCLSDLFAMGATPQSALAIVTLPYATEAKLAEMLYQLLSGAVQVLHQAGAQLVGGHTTEGAELSLGLTCNGLAFPQDLWRKSGMQPGQALILTKALGTGTLFAAEMQLQAQGRWIEAAIASMKQSNQMAAQCLRQFNPTACTDVTGFGLLGHLLDLVQASQVSAELDLGAVPLLPGARATLEQGIFSSLYPQNLRAAGQINHLEVFQTHPLFPILFDPQTAGGLLASLPLEQAADCIAALQALGYHNSCIIGQVTAARSGLPIELKASFSSG